MLKKIQHIVAPQLEMFDKTYWSQLQSSVQIINDINSYLTQRKGKMLRPLLLFLSAGAAMPAVPDYKVRLAVALEMLHNSSLIHDDVIDESDLRRNRPTVNKMWTNQIAVLSGDYYLAQMMHLISLHASAEERDMVCRTAVEMTEGELLQQQNSRTLCFDEQTYFDTIYKKTASLMAACCEVGAYGTTLELDGDLSAGQRLREFGRLFGLAFQMRDDILDYTPEAETGKPCGNDIKEKKMTLPLLLFLKQASASDHQYVMDLLNGAEVADADAQRVVDMVYHSEALKQTRERVSQYLYEARRLLMPLPATSYKEGLEQLSELLLCL